jgi:hypothetical protein
MNFTRSCKAGKVVTEQTIIASATVALAMKTQPLLMQ